MPVPKEPLDPFKELYADDLTYGPYEISPVRNNVSVTADDVLLAAHSVPVSPVYTKVPMTKYEAQADPQIWAKDNRATGFMLEDGITALGFEPDIPGNMLFEADENYDALTVNSGSPPGREFMGSRACAVCGQLYKYKDLVFFRGAHYGVPCGDYKDIKGILRREQDARHVGRSRDEQRSR